MRTAYGGTLLLRPKLRTVISTLPMRIGAIVWKSSVPLDS